MGECCIYGTHISLGIRTIGLGSEMGTDRYQRPKRGSAGPCWSTAAGSAVQTLPSHQSSGCTVDADRLWQNMFFSEASPEEGLSSTVSCFQQPLKGTRALGNPLGTNRGEE